jgi:integrase
VESAERYASAWYETHIGDGSRAIDTSQTTLSPSTTLEAFGAMWTSGDLARRFPDHIKVKRSADDDERILRLYVYPIVGAQRLARFEGQCGLDLMEKVMAGLPPVGKTFSRASRRHVLQAMHRLLVLATYPARLISGNPLPKGFLPRATSNRAKSYVYPAEDLALLQCRTVPLVARFFFGILAREGLRTSEALALTWADVDLERGVLVLDQNKTDEPRSWPLDPGSSSALRLWKKHFARSKGAGARVMEDKSGGSINVYTAASLLRESLQLAGVTRPQLFESSESRIALRAHDLRAGFVTVSLATGKTESWVTDRTGHRSSQMLYLYRRQSRSHVELNLGPYTPLDVAIPELAEAAASL